MPPLVGKIGEREIVSGWNGGLLHFPILLLLLLLPTLSPSLLLFPSPPAPHRRSHSSWGTGNCVRAETPRLCWSEWPPSIPAPQRRKPNQGARFAFVIKYLPEVNWVARARLVLLFQFLGLNESGAALSRLCLTRCESGSESQMRIKAVKVFRTDAAGYYNASILNIASLIGTPYSV